MAEEMCEKYFTDSSQGLDIDTSYIHNIKLAIKQEKISGAEFDDLQAAVSLYARVVFSYEKQLIRHGLPDENYSTLYSYSYQCLVAGIHHVNCKLWGNVEASVSSISP